MSEKVTVECNEQIGRELGASKRYLNTAAYSDGETLSELAGFVYRQADEEREHALKVAKFLVAAGAKLAVPAVETLRADIGSADAALKLSGEWEMEVPRQINALLDPGTPGEGPAGGRRPELVRRRATGEIVVDGGRASPNRQLFVEDFLARQGAKS